MYNLTELEEKGVKFIVCSENPIDKEILRKQVNMNGSLNDCNLGHLTTRFGIKYLDSIVASIYATQNGNEVNLGFLNGNNLIPYCDFPLATASKDLSLKNQSIQLYNYLGNKYIQSLGLEISPIVPTKYNLCEGRNIETGKPVIEIERLRNSKSLDVNNYWKTIEGMMNLGNINYPELSKFLFTFQHDLKRTFKQGSCDLNENIYLFVNLSNFQAMINEFYNRGEIKRDHSLEEKVFLDYGNKLEVANMNTDSITLELNE